MSVSWPKLPRLRSVERTMKISGIDLVTGEPVTEEIQYTDRGLLARIGWWCSYHILRQHRFKRVTSIECLSDG